MSERSWYRSLYWRIAVGFIVFLAVMLVVRAALFVWLTVGSSAAGLRLDAMDDLSRVVAADLGSTLRRDGSIDVEAHLREQYGEVAALILVVFRDGRVASTKDREPPRPLVRLATARLRRMRPARRGRFAAGPGPQTIGMAACVSGTVPSLLSWRLGTVPWALSSASSHQSCCSLPACCWPPVPACRPCSSSDPLTGAFGRSRRRPCACAPVI